MNNYYTILGLQESATDDQIKQAYRTLAKRYHPDLHPNDEETAKKFALINEAMEVLGNPTKRKEYDSKRAAEKKQADATAARAEAVRAAQARAAAARANGGRPAGSMGGMGGSGMGGGGMYAGSAQGAAAVINDAYRRGYNEATAMFQQQRNVAVDTWKKSADNWKAEADRWKAEAERLRREVDRQRAETEEYMRDVDTLKAALERTRTRAADAEAAARRAETELRIQTGVTEIAKKSVADEAAQRDAIRESYEAKLNAEREARKYSDEDKIRLSREVARLKQEIAELKGEAQATAHNFDTNDYPPHEAATATPYTNTRHEATAGARSYDIPTYTESVKAKSPFGVGGIDYPDTATHREESYTAEPAKPTVTEDVITKITELSARALGEDDGDAALILGKMYMSGDEVPKKEKDAMLWFKRAAETGNAEAIFNLGLCYVYGNGCDPDYDKGMAFIKEAAAKSCKEATEFLANAQ